MALEVTDILGGPVAAWYAPVGEAPPDEDVAAGTAWGGNWAQVGYTKEALKMIYEYETEDWKIQESLGAVNRRKIGHDCRFELMLAEHSVVALQLSFGGTVNTTAAGAGQVGFEELTLGDEAVLDKMTWGFEGKYTDEDGDVFPVRMFIHIATAIAGGELEYSKDNGYTGVPLKVSALSDMSQIEAERFFKLLRVLEPST